MGQKFIACDREQSCLMPPDVRERLPEGHLAWFVLDAVGEMDLEAFYGAHRRDGRSRPAYDPAMMVALWCDSEYLSLGQRGSGRPGQFSEGEPSELEEDLLPDGDADWDAWEHAEEERVMEIASAWSIDPIRLDERADVADAGLLGRR